MTRRLTVAVALALIYAHPMDAQVATPAWAVGVSWQTLFPAERSLGLFVSRSLTEFARGDIGMEASGFAAVGKPVDAICVGTASGSCDASTTKKVVQVLTTVRVGAKVASQRVRPYAVLGIGPYVAINSLPEAGASDRARLGAVVSGGAALVGKAMLVQLTVRSYLGPHRFAKAGVLGVSVGRQF